MKNLFIITGSTKGLGLSLYQKVQKEENFDIICLSRTRSESEKFNNVKSIKCDYSNVDETIVAGSILKSSINLRYEKIFFINNISMIQPIGRVGELESADVIKSVNTNITSNLIILNVLLNKFNNKSTRFYILNISSGISKSPVPGLALYGIGKAYMDYISTIINKEKLSDRLLISTFYPAGMDTNMQNVLRFETRSKSSLRNFDYEKIYTQKLRKPDEIAQIILENYIFKSNGWDKEVASVYDYI